MFEDFISYIKHEKYYAINTLISYQKDLSDFVIYLENNHDCGVSEVNIQILRAYVVYLSKQNLSSASINRKISCLKSYYNFRLRKGLDLSSPASSLKSLKNPRKIQIPFSDQEIKNVLDSSDFFTNSFIDIRDRLIILVLYYTGIRRSELVGIKWNDIDLSSKEIKIFGKRSKQRIVPILDSLIDEIKCYKALVLDKFNLLPTYFFVKENGELIHSNIVYKVVNSYFSLVSVKQKKSPHILRHSFATHLLNSGADVSAIKDLMGHSSLSSTQVYVHTDINRIRKVMNQSHPRSGGDKN